MLAIDTNLIVRYLTGDHPKQSAQARQLIDNEDTFVCTTVLLEAEWVLRSAYGFAPAQLLTALRAFAGLPRVTIEDAGIAAQALSWAESGMDFAAALHLAKARSCAAFVSFDQHLVRAANRLNTVKARVP